MIANYPVDKDKFPYIEAVNYTDKKCIIEAFPHLKSINEETDWATHNNIEGLIIRSANDDNVHKAIKYGIWTTTPKNRTKLQHAFLRNTQIYLFFSVVKSGMFEGVARLTSNINQETFPFWWEDHSLKFKGFFKIQWIYIKDVNYKHFNDLYNTDGEQIVKSKDCDCINAQTTKRMLQIFSKKPMKNKWIFNDFQYMDKRQKNYTRPLIYHQLVEYPPNYQFYNNGYNTYQQANYQQPQMMPFPPQMMKPNQTSVPQRTDLGFQMNPISKNRKK